MGDAILRAKYECEQLNGDEWKGTTQFGDNVDNQLENPSVQKNQATDDDKIEKTERSFIGPAFDVTGNQWNGWFDREKMTESEEENLQSEQDNSESEEENSESEEENLQDNTFIGGEREDAVSENDGSDNDDVAVVVDNNDCDHEQPIDEESVNDNGFLDQNYIGNDDESTDNQTTESANIEQVNSEEPHNTEEHDDTETEPTEEQEDLEAAQNSEELQGTESPENTEIGELGNDPYDPLYYDPETSNNENNKGWFENVIDKFSSYFS